MARKNRKEAIAVVETAVVEDILEEAIRISEEAKPEPESVVEPTPPPVAKVRITWTPAMMSRLREMWTPEKRDALAAKMRIYWAEHPAPWTGKAMSDETKDRIRQSHLRRFAVVRESQNDNTA